jgi:tetratricopeptide (TPR) repeat protein
VNSETGHTLSRESLERFAAGTATPEERRTIVRHLLACCNECRQGLQGILSGGAAAEDYQRAIGNALERALAVADRAQKLPPARLLLSELDRQPALRRETLARNHPRYRSIDLVEILAERSFSQRFKDHAAMLCDARVAVLLAAGLDSAVPGGSERATDASFRAWAYYGNALRVVGRLAEANGAFSRAMPYVDSGSCAPEVEALAYDLLATLRKDERRFDEAAVLLEGSARIYRNLKRRDKLGRTLLNGATNAFYAGKSCQALEILLEASALIDAEREPTLAISAVLTAVRCYLDEDQPDQALSIFLVGQDLFQTDSNPLLSLKISWIEGQLLAALGHLEAARNLLERVRNGYIERKFHFHVALAALDLALVLTQMGRFGEVRSLISQSLPIFQSLRINRELLASIILLTEADRQASYVAIIREAARRLEREPGAVNVRESS